MEPILGSIPRSFGYPLTVVLPWRVRGRLRAALSSLFAAALLWPWQPALAQFRQDGQMLVSNDGVGGGDSVALSGDGTTAIVGGPGSPPLTRPAYVYTVTPVAWSQQGSGLVANGFPSAEGAAAISADGNTAILGAPTEALAPDASSLAWVFTRSGGTWSQQVELTGSNVNGVSLGTVVALSADGNTTIVGVSLDSNGTGAAWVFTRSSGVWSQQGPKLVGSGAIGLAGQGGSIALSGDGNTAIVGGLNDNNGVGAAWVFTRSNGVWTQQGKLVGSGVAGTVAGQGISVALSGDGNTAVVGGNRDNNGAGAVWVFTRSGGQWTQQGGKLVGTGAVGTQVNQGFAVGLSADGNLAIVGGPNDNGGGNATEIGAAWLFARSGGVWSQLQKLVSNEFFSGALFGRSVALSADGRTAIVGAPGLVNGGAFLFIGPSRRATDTHDFNGDGKSDIAWRDTSGNLAVWLMNGATVSSSGGLGAVPTTWSVVGQRDFNNDGKGDFLWQNTSTGDVAIWLMNGAQVTQAAGVGNVPPSAWSIVGTGDFNGDSRGDILWRDTSGNVAVWFMNGAQVTRATAVSSVPANWSIAGTGDFNGDGKSDILWRDTTNGNVAIWLMNGAQVTQSYGLGNAPTAWSIVGTGDFNGDGYSDILWRDSSGNVAIWFAIQGNPQFTPAGVGNAPTAWSIVETGDFDGDGLTDILWHDTSGNVAIWFMVGEHVTRSAGVGNAPTVWSIQGVNAD
jgi:hypothetical protein